MKTRITVLCVLVALLFSGCDRPRKISDEDLESIFYDLYLTTAYVAQTIISDSVDAYTPVLRRYGYELRDLHYTMSEFARRKSSRMSDIINAVEQRFESEYNVMNARYEMLQRMDTLINERYRREVLARDRIVIDDLDDTSRLTFHLPVQRGRYRIEYNYRVDTTDKNAAIRFGGYMVRKNGKYTASLPAVWLSMRQPGRVATSVKVDDDIRELVFRPAIYPRNAKKPSMQIDSLRVWYYLPDGMAADSLMYDTFSYVSVFPKNDYDTQTDSAFYVLLPPTAAQRDSLRR